MAAHEKNPPLIDRNLQLIEQNRQLGLRESHVGVIVYRPSARCRPGWAKRSHAVRERQAAVPFQAALGALPSGSAETAMQDDGLRDRVRVAEGLVALDLARESRVRESLRMRLAQALEERRQRPATSVSRLLCAGRRAA